MRSGAPPPPAGRAWGSKKRSCHEESIQRIESRARGRVGRGSAPGPAFPCGVPCHRGGVGGAAGQPAPRVGSRPGQASLESFDQAVEVVGRFEQPEYRGTLVRQPTGPHTRQLLLLMEPARATAVTLRPGAVVPLLPSTRWPATTWRRGADTRAPRSAVRPGICPAGLQCCLLSRRSPSTRCPIPAPGGFALSARGAKKLLQDNPQWTRHGQARLGCLAAALLLEQPDVTPSAF